MLLQEDLFMKTRRGSSLWAGQLAGMIHQFEPGDLVKSVIANSDNLIGTVQGVDLKAHKLMVAWNGGSLVQHDPDEVVLVPFADELTRARLDSMPRVARRVKQASFDLDGKRIGIRQKVSSTGEKAADSFGSGFPTSEFVCRFLQLYSQFYLFHWQADTYAAHVAFESASEDLSGLMDQYVEACQGKHGLVSISTRSLVVENIGEVDPVEFSTDYRDFLQECKEMVPEEDADLGNIIDEMVARINKLLYLLTLG
jgi:hypothetical protein